MKIMKNLTLAALAVAAFVTLSAMGPAQLALADAGGVKGHTFDVTFTKWITTFPNMAGIVGDDVGDGAFAGEILNINTVGTITKIEALYHVYGSRHSFTAHIFVTQDNVAGMAAIIGEVTEGWLEGAHVTGEYKVLAHCNIGTTGTCFQGTLNINKNSHDSNADWKGHTFDVSFTKWVTSLPANPPSLAGVSMAGVVGGDVGDGIFTGEVLRDDLSVPGFWLAHARYEFHGEQHSFIADVHVKENDTTTPATAVVTGVITQGWLKGARLTGGYTVVPVSPIPTPGNVFGTLCFQGALEIKKDSND